jgi:hypothetical protein
VYWIDLTQDRDQFSAGLTKVMNCLVQEELHS